MMNRKPTTASTNSSGETPPIPPLSKCIDMIKTIPTHHVYQPNRTKIHAEMFTASLAFLCHLKADRDTIAGMAKAAQSEVKDDTTERFLLPTPDKIPAITAVLEDAVLFQVLLDMLSSSPQFSTQQAQQKQIRSLVSSNALSTLGGSTSSGLSSGFISEQRKRSGSTSSGVSSGFISEQRKRSGSEGSVALKVQNKFPKRHHSTSIRGTSSMNKQSTGTKPSNTTTIYGNKKNPKNHNNIMGYGSPPLSPSLSHHHQVQGGGGGGQNNNEFHPRLFAATVLCVSLQHIDHWPTALVKVYAQDAFDLRSWVDDPRCKQLVKNIETVFHNKDDSIDSSSLDQSSQKMAHRFSHLALKGSPNNNIIVSIIEPLESSQHQTQLKRNTTSPFKRMKLTHIDGVKTNGTKNKDGNYSDTTDSDSGDEELIVEEMSMGSSSIKEKNTNNSNNNNHNKVRIASHMSNIQLMQNNKPPSSLSSSSLSKIPRMIGTSLIDQQSKLGDSSSSGEDDEEEVLIQDSRFPNALASGGKQQIETTTLSNHEASSSYGNHPKYCYFSLIGSKESSNTNLRPKFVGQNKELAFQLISKVFSERLALKTRQYSGLLSILPIFTVVPQIRSTVARNLERWLQSPALSGFARALFVSIVDNMKNVDPPLPEDIGVIESLLSMKLKANQFSMYIENVTKMSQNIPTQSVASQIFYHLLNTELSEIIMEGPSSSNAKIITSSKMNSISDSLRVFIAAHNAISPKFSSTAIASALVKLLCFKEENIDDTDTDHRILSICSLLQRLSLILGKAYDGHSIIKSLLSENYGSIKEYDAIARLVYECTILVVPALPTSIHRNHGHTTSGSIVGKTSRQQQLALANAIDFSSKQSREKISPEILVDLLKIRKLILKWCLSKYSKMFRSVIDNDEAERKKSSIISAGHNTTKKKKKKHNQNNPVGAGAGVPDYTCILDNQTQPFSSSHSKNEKDESSHHFISTLQCLLFLYSSCDHPELIAFLSYQKSSDSSFFDTLPIDYKYRMNFCSSYGTDLDDEILWIILNAFPKSGLKSQPTIALELIENLFFKCQNAFSSNIISLSDPNLIWELYKSFAKYTPDKKQKVKHENEMDTDDDDDDVKIADLAYPGIWWRVTTIGLIMCGISPEKVGSEMWNSHPTISSLIKMTTSGRYRFPTADCDESQKEMMKQQESELREQELKITKYLFLPKALQSKKKGPSSDSNSMNPYSSGIRSSKRQFEKLQRRLIQQREEEEAKERAEAQRIKKLLQAAQKSIMIYDPTGPSRKPPKESVGLILSADALFGLSDSFRRSQSPDYLMMTIGGTTRGFIERSYGWLIPIISSNQHIIHRLAPSTSCVLLLKAYGTDVDSSHSQLLELAAPLLHHVNKCLDGHMGETDAIEAANLLLSDIADSSADRRRCARRVLHEAIGNFSTTPINDIPESWISLASLCRCSWLFNLLQVKYTPTLTPTIIKYLSTALSYERGRVLVCYTLGIHSFIAFSERNNLEGTYNFASTLCNLLSSRAQVCGTVMDQSPDFRQICLDTIYQEWNNQLSLKYSEDNEEKNDDSSLVRLKVIVEDDIRDVIITLTLLNAAILILSCWKIEEENESTRNNNENDLEEPKNHAVKQLSHFLIVSDNNNLSSIKSHKTESETLLGVAGALFVNGNERAVCVNRWVLLAKSSCAFIARHAALSAPSVFLPRLILCSGLSRVSLFTMLDRLGKLGDHESDDGDDDNSADTTNKNNNIYMRLISPSAASEWKLGNLGSRRAIARKLLGRIRAYLKIFKTENENDVGTLSSPAFVMWLSEQCNENPPEEKASSTKRHQKKNRSNNNNNNNKSQQKDVSPPDFLKSYTDALQEIHKITSTDHLTLESGLSERNECIDFFNIDDDKLEDLQQQQQVMDSRKDLEIKNRDSFNSEQLEDLITKCWKENKVEYLSDLDQQLEYLCRETIRDSDYRCKVAVDILSCFHHSHKNSSSPNSPSSLRFINKWIPKLTRQNGGFALWKLLFTSHHSGTTAQEDIDTILFSSCIQVWAKEHIQSCQTWVLSELITNNLKDDENISLAKLVKFFVLTSDQLSLHRHSFLSENNFCSKPVFASSQNNANATISLALKCAQRSYDNNDETSQYSNRNMLPDWLTLILLIAKCNKKCCSLVTKQILSSLVKAKDQEGKRSSSCRTNYLHATLLRIYVYFPSLIGLGDATLRKELLHAAAIFAHDFVQWRCPIDDQVNEMLNNLSQYPHQRLVQSIVDLSKKHPLIIVKQLKQFLQILNEDGKCTFGNNNNINNNINGNVNQVQMQVVEKRGRVHADDGKVALAKIDVISPTTTTVKVKVRYWGNSFTEPIWISILDILLSLPNEVLFASSCSFELGLFDLLCVYLKLIVIQKVMKSEQNTTRIRSKMASLIQSFKECNPDKWTLWLSSEIHDARKWGTVSELCSKCNISEPAT